MSNVTTMGSVIAIDAGGSHWLKYGSARQHVISLQVVLADGDVLEVGREPLEVSRSRIWKRPAGNSSTCSAISCGATPSRSSRTSPKAW